MGMDFKVWAVPDYVRFIRMPESISHRKKKLFLNPLIYNVFLGTLSVEWKRCGSLSETIGEEMCLYVFWRQIV